MEVQLGWFDRFVSIRRNDMGVSRIIFDSENVVLAGLGFASATDRMFQIKYDPRRAVGRLGESLGSLAPA